MRFTGIIIGRFLILITDNIQHLEDQVFVNPVLEDFYGLYEGKNFKNKINETNIVGLLLHTSHLYSKLEITYSIM